MERILVCNDNDLEPLNQDSDQADRGKECWVVLHKDYETLRARLAACEAECTKWRRIRTPTHGPCCTCQKCGQHYDDCRCDLDEVADELEQTKARVQALEAQLAELTVYDARTMARGQTMMSGHVLTVQPLTVEQTLLGKDVEIRRLEQEQARLRDLLQELHDLQNGPPLIKYRDAWNACMKQVENALEGG